VERFTEAKTVAQPLRRNQREAVHRLMKRRFDEAVAERQAAFDPARARPDQLAKVIGWPLHDGPPRDARLIDSTHLGDDADASIHRLIFDILPNHGSLPMHGLLMLPHAPGPHALCISQHGGGGTPELCSGLLESGSANYNDQSRRLIRRGYAVFAPQLMMWNADQFGEPHEREAVDQRLKQLNSSIAGIEVFAISSMLDRLLGRDDIDPARVAMMGLSYGGFYTLVTAAMDARIKAAAISCIFHDGDVMRFADQAWPDSVRRFGFAEIAALIAPRPLYIEHGRLDDVLPFQARRTEAVATQVGKYYSALGAADRFTFHVHEASHETDQDDGWLDFLCDAVRPTSD
jgi:dienelactone hydrolase